MAGIAEAAGRGLQWPKYGGLGVFRWPVLFTRDTNPGNPGRYVGVAGWELS
jgi:hypothetical protein